MQSESLVQFLPLPLTRKSWANSVNFCCLIYKTTIKRAHPSPIPDHNAMSGSVYISLGTLQWSLLGQLPAHMDGLCPLIHQVKIYIFLNLFIYFIFGCTGDFAIAPGLSLIVLRGPLNHSGLSGCRAQALGTWASAMVAQGLSCPTA